MKFRLLHSMLVLLFFASNSFAKEINITSDNLIIDRKKNISIFTGSVYVNEKNLEIWADKLIVKFNNDQEEVEELVASVNVKIVRNDLIATGEKGLYFPLLEEIQMFDNVEIMENNNFIRCDELVIDIKNSISIMKSKSVSRVEAFIKDDN